MRPDRLIPVVLIAAAALVVLVIFSRDVSMAVDPPPPLAEPDGSWVPDVPVSMLNVPIRYDLSNVIESLESVVPASYGSLADRIAVGDNDRAHVAFTVSRDPFHASLIADRARISSVLRYRARAWYDPPLLPEVRTTCGSPEEPLRAVVSLSARIWLSEAWGLRSDGRVDHVGPLSEEDRDKCEITPLGIDVTDRVMESARDALQGYLPDLERALSRVDVRSRFERWWATLAEPIRLSDDVWLLIDPVGVHRGSTSGQGHVLVAEVGLAARPHIVLGTPPSGPPPPLPPLGEPLDVSGLHIRATGTATYPTASERLSEVLAGKEVVQQGQTLVIDSVDVLGIGGGRLSLDIFFSGSARGHFYLVGTPAYDPSTGEVYVPDLSFSVETANLLLQGMTWLAEEEILEFFRARARWQVDDLAAFAREQLLTGLNRTLTDEVRLTGEVDSVEILGVYPLTTQLVVHAEARARALLIISEVGDTT